MTKIYKDGIADGVATGVKTMAQERRYYTLLTREHKNETWAIEFGDYDREVVDQERRDLRDGMSSGHQFKIIGTRGDQKSINAAVAALNAALPLSAHAGDCGCAGCHIARIAS